MNLQLTPISFIEFHGSSYIELNYISLAPRHVLGTINFSHILSHFCLVYEHWLKCWSSYLFCRFLLHCRRTSSVVPELFHCCTRSSSTQASRPRYPSFVCTKITHTVYFDFIHNFLKCTTIIVFYHSIYNCIMGRPTLAILGAMPSIVHLNMKYHKANDEVVMCVDLLEPDNAIKHYMKAVRRQPS